MLPLTFDLAVALLAFFFAWAALAKLIRPGRWRDALARYGPKGGTLWLLVVAVPASEAAVAILLILGNARVGGALALALLSVFSMAILDVRTIQGDKLPCGCFGTEERDYRSLLLRNVLLGGLATVALLLEPSSVETAAALREHLVPFTLVAAGVSLGVWMVYQVSVSMRKKH